MRTHCDRRRAKAAAPGPCLPGQRARLHQPQLERWLPTASPVHSRPWPGRAGPPSIQLHELRHGPTTPNGTELHVRRFLGHAQVTTTRIDTNPTDPLTREAADRIEQALWPDAPEAG